MGVYPEWWGIDGTADDVQIQAAIDSLPSSGGKVLLSDVTYVLEMGARIYGVRIAKSNVAFSGVGAASIVKLANSQGTGAAHSAIIQMGDGINSYEGIVVENLLVDGNKANQTQVLEGISGFRNLSKCCVRNCQVKNIYGYGIGFTSSADSKMQNNEVSGCKYTGIGVDNCNRMTISGNRCIGNSCSSGVHGSGGIGVYDSNYCVVSNNICDGNLTGIFVGGSHNCTINNNVCINATDEHGFYLAGGSHNTCVGNVTYNNHWCGIHIGPGLTDSVVSGNSIYNEGSYGVLIDTGADKNIVSNNLIHTTNGNAEGIKLCGDNHQIVNNIVYGADADGILVDGGNPDIITGNVISGNTVISPDGYGIRLYHGVEHALVSNNKVISAGDKAISVATSVDSYNTIINNDVKDIFVGDGVGNMVRNNRGGDEEDVLIDGSTLHYWGVSRLQSAWGKVDTILPDGQITGETKTIVKINWGNPSTVTILHHETSSPEVATFTNDWEMLMLMWTGIRWITIKATCTFV
jgi:parallel beta-helix repeat protein